ncbi:MAG: lipopolysaccharide export LptBFGC system permease protein LptF [Kiritimatiellia bacterium]|jgi:lipopolysaccharide export LptBFGC system permease protein LptF
MKQANPQKGFITLEFLLGLTLILVVFVLLLNMLIALWIQVRVEDQAQVIVRESARTYQPVGTVQQRVVFDGRGSAEIRWDTSNVWVRVAVNNTSISSERLMPREIP